MGQVVIEIPQNIFVTYRVDDSDLSERLLKDLKPFSKSPVRDDVVPPRSGARQEALKAALGIWSGRKESAQEIARKIRKENRKVT